VRYYTRESGVRNLEREIAKICRKVVKEIALAGPQPVKAKKGAKKKALVSVSSKNLDKYLGVRRFDFGRAEEENEIGLVTGLAWTEVGGDLLQIESTLVPGKGQLILTGQLGDVMKESASAALSVVRSRAVGFGIDSDFLQKHDVHLHVPDGATPKDGPSAGAAMVTSLVSMLTKVPVRADVAMTGEITLRGRVTAIGGLKEKLLAALRGGIRTVIIPKRTARTWPTSGQRHPRSGDRAGEVHRRSPGPGAGASVGTEEGAQECATCHGAQQGQTEWKRARQALTRAVQWPETRVVAGFPACVGVGPLV
jgi:ATP-dependent Lon protease